MRAKTIPHAEYELLTHIMESIDIEPIISLMAQDVHSEKRVISAGENVATLIQNLAERRRHRLPLDHPDYKEKGE